MARAQAMAAALSLGFHGVVLALVSQTLPRGGDGASIGDVSSASFPLAETNLENSQAPAAAAMPILPPTTLRLPPPILDPSPFSRWVPAASLPFSAAVVSSPGNGASARGGLEQRPGRSSGRRAGHGGGDVAGGIVYRPPRYLNNPPPSYPDAARRSRREGVVLLAVEVDTRGRPGAVLLRRSSGDPALDSAAVRAVRTWRFEPARLQGQPVAATVEIPVRFKLR